LSPGAPSVQGGGSAVGPRALVRSEGRLAFATGSELLETSVQGGPTTTLLVPPSWCAGELAVDATNVYASTIQENDEGANLQQLVQVPLAGGTPVTLLPAGYASGIAVDPTHVFYGGEVACDAAACGAVSKVPIDGGAPARIAETPYGPPQLYVVIAVDATSVYFASGPYVFKVTPK
jgi:hypothetical protein